MKLTLEIEFGNDEMQTYAQARAVIAESVRTGALKPRDGDGGILRDVNGNTVGRWAVLADKPKVDGVCTTAEELAAERAALSAEDLAKLAALPETETE